MATVLNYTSPSVFRQSLISRRIPKSNFCVRASMEVGSKGNTGAGAAKPAHTFSPPPNFKPPEPKRFGIRPDKIFDILGASLALVFRLGTGVFVSGYSGSFVSKDEIPAGQYALEL